MSYSKILNNLYLGNQYATEVIKNIDNNDQETKGIMSFNDKVHNDPRVENVLFPVRDGLMVARKL